MADHQGLYAATEPGNETDIPTTFGPKPQPSNVAANPLSPGGKKGTATDEFDVPREVPGVPTKTAPGKTSKPYAGGGAAGTAEEAGE